MFRSESKQHARIEHFIKLNDFEEAMKSVKLLDTEDKRESIRSLIQKSVILSSLGKHDVAFENAETAFKMSKEENYRKGIICSIVAMSEPLWRFGEYFKGLEILQEAEVILSTISTEDSSDSHELTEIKGKIHLAKGKMHNFVSEFEKATEFYEEALGLFRSVSDRISEGTALAWLSLVYREQGKLGESLEFAEKGVDIYCKVKTN